MFSLISIAKIIKCDVLSMISKKSFFVYGQSKNTPGGQVLSLIQTLKKRGKLAFSHFLNTLHDTDQGHVAERLEIYAQNQRQGRSTHIAELIFYIICKF